MKFYWFAEVTYPHVPTAIQDELGGSWVGVPRGVFDPERGADLYDDYLGEYLFADRMGFDGVVVNEHHQYAGAVTPSPNLLAAILARTARGAIVVLGNSLALYNPPVRVAEELAMLDLLSRGRVVAGFVVGTPMDACHAYGVNPAELRARWREAHDLIIRAWSATEPFTFNGRFTKLRHVNPWPRTFQQPRPPVWMPGTSSVETWDFAAERDYCYCHLSFSGAEKARDFVRDYWEHLATTGGDTSPHRFAFTQVICVAETDAQAERDYAAAVEYFFHRVTAAPPRFAAAPGYLSKRSAARAGGGAAPLSRERGAGSPPRYRDLVASGHVVAGSPATVRERLAALAEELRVGKLICILQMGNLDPALTEKNTELFAREVMPHLRGLFDEAPDRWVPAALRDGSDVHVA